LSVATFEWTYELRFLIALAIGFLVGLERESTKQENKSLFLGGVRTFPIVSLFGFGCAWIYRLGAAFILPTGLLTITALTVVAYMAKVKAGRYGATSELSLIVTFIVGALALLVDVWVSMAIGVVMTLMLSEKAGMEEYVEKLDRVGFLATLKFLLVTVIILPVLPDHDYTQFKLNPSHIWQIVALVSTVGYVGYLLSTRYGKKAGMWMSGLLGGIISSTAVSISAGREAQKDPSRAGAALQATILASSVMYLRILVLIAIVAPGLVAVIWWRLCILSAIGFGLAAMLKHQPDSSSPGETPELHNPFEIRPAMLFAVLFVALSVFTTVVKQHLGDTGTFGLALVVGVADVDPFILSLLRETDLVASIAATAIVLATMSNTIAKGIYFGTLAATVRRQTAIRYAIWAFLHLVIVFL
jgi:uncharacterized membrane protein (DUF4010 family)